MRPFPPTSFPRPLPSFPAPVRPPTSDPDVGPQAHISVGCEWLPYIRGALEQLGLQATWAGTLSEQLLAQQRAALLIDLFLGQSPCDCDEPCPSVGGLDCCGDCDMSCLRVDCSCNAFVKCCDGTERQLATLVQAQAPGQPGAGQPQPTPGGGKATYCFKLPGSGQVILPTGLNSGDQIRVVSSEGAWLDGERPGFPWSCPNGHDFILGSCTVGFSLEGGNPVPTVPDMQLIVKIGGAYFDVWQADSSGNPGVFTVPPGIVNQPCIFLANDATPSGNQGEISFCAEVTNNQAAIFQHPFDFTGSPLGWVADVVGGVARAQWVSGVGWKSNDPAFLGLIQVLAPTIVAGVNVTRLDFYLSSPLAGPTDLPGYSEAGGANPFYVASGSSVVIVDGPNAATLYHQLFANIQSDNTVGNNPYTGALQKIIVYGLGADPY